MSSDETDEKTCVCNTEEFQDALAKIDYIHNGAVVLLESSHFFSKLGALPDIAAKLGDLNAKFEKFGEALDMMENVSGGVRTEVTSLRTELIPPATNIDRVPMSVVKDLHKFYLIGFLVFAGAVSAMFGLAWKSGILEKVLLRP